ncbi:hypothetical protein FA15DRAFT_114462 [Coprinopsis marcescibilis]|uniref:Nephrocystin 3-like N-terminal domain-containing protein n=1 Tax=Coprinopsis marcescibilis TaxID=230819 RepID=A0A5C3KKF7_COPMA|nr:hypothetical protein FA15DRAFT_114462 [Coprinopsis marcescibilis]
MPSKLKDFIRRKIIKSSKFSSVTLNATGFAVEAEVAAASVPQSTQQPDLNTSSLQKLAFSPGILTVNPTRPTPAVHSRSNSSFQTLIGSASGQDVADSTPPPSGIAVEPTSPLASPTSTLQRTPALRKRLFRADSRLRLNLDDGPSRFPFDTVEPPTTADDFPVHLARQVVNPGLLQGAQDISITGSTLQSAGRDIIVHNTPAVEISQVVKIMTHWLTKINQKAIWLDNISNWTEGTGSWFFELDKFRAWMEQDAGILCGTGMPGAGKTILSSRVLQHLQEHAMTSKENICVVFVFFRYMDRITTYDTLASVSTIDTIAEARIPQQTNCSLC